MDYSLSEPANRTYSRFVLQYVGGGYHAVGRGNSYLGFDTIETVTDAEDAAKFGTFERAVSRKNNTSHLRHVPMKVIELQYEVRSVDRGDVPITEPDWDDFDPHYDAVCFAEQQSASAKRHGVLAAEARQRIM